MTAHLTSSSSVEGFPTALSQRSFDAARGPICPAMERSTRPPRPESDVVVSSGPRPRGEVPRQRQDESRAIAQTPFVEGGGNDRRPRPLRRESPQSSPVVASRLLLVEKRTPSITTYNNNHNNHNNNNNSGAATAIYMRSPGKRMELTASALKTKGKRGRKQVAGTLRRSKQGVSTAPQPQQQQQQFQQQAQPPHHQQQQQQHSQTQQKQQKQQTQAQNVQQQTPDHRSGALTGSRSGHNLSGFLLLTQPTVTFSSPTAAPAVRRYATNSNSVSESEEVAVRMSGNGNGPIPSRDEPQPPAQPARRESDPTRARHAAAKRKPAAPAHRASDESQNRSDGDFELFQPPDGTSANPRRFLQERDSLDPTSSFQLNHPISSADARLESGDFAANSLSATGVSGSKECFSLAVAVVAEDCADRAAFPTERNADRGNYDRRASPILPRHIRPVAAATDGTGRYTTSVSAATPLVENLKGLSAAQRRDGDAELEIRKSGHEGAATAPHASGVQRPDGGKAPGRYDDAVVDASITQSNSVQLSQSQHPRMTSSTSSFQFHRPHPAPVNDGGTHRDDASGQNGRYGEAGCSGWSSPSQAPLKSDSISRSPMATTGGGQKLFSPEQLRLLSSPLLTQRGRLPSPRSGGIGDGTSPQCDLVRMPIRGTLKAKLLGAEPPETEEEQEAQRLRFMERIMKAQTNTKEANPERGAKAAAVGRASLSRRRRARSRECNFAVADEKGVIGEAGETPKRKVTFDNTVTETTFYTESSDGSSSDEGDARPTDRRARAGAVGVRAECRQTVLNDLTARGEGCLDSRPCFSSDNDKNRGGGVTESRERCEIHAALRSPPPPASIPSLAEVLGSAEETVMLSLAPAGQQTAAAEVSVRADAVHTRKPVSPPGPTSHAVVLDPGDLTPGGKTAPRVTVESPLAPERRLGEEKDLSRGRNSRLNASDNVLATDSLLPVTFTRVASKSDDNNVVMETPVVHSKTDFADIAVFRRPTSGGQPEVLSGEVTPGDLTDSKRRFFERKGSDDPAWLPPVLQSPAFANGRFRQHKKELGHAFSCPQSTPKKDSGGPSTGEAPLNGPRPLPILPVHESYMQFSVKVTPSARRAPLPALHGDRSPLSARAKGTATNVENSHPQPSPVPPATATFVSKPNRQEIQLPTASANTDISVMRTARHPPEDASHEGSGPDLPSRASPQGSDCPATSPLSRATTLQHAAHAPETAPLHDSHSKRQQRPRPPPALNSGVKAVGPSSSSREASETAASPTVERPGQGTVSRVGTTSTAPLTSTSDETTAMATLLPPLKTTVPKNDQQIGPPAYSTPASGAGQGRSDSSVLMNDASTPPPEFRPATVNGNLS